MNRPVHSLSGIPEEKNNAGYTEFFKEKSCSAQAAPPPKHQVIPGTFNLKKCLRTFTARALDPPQVPRFLAQFLSMGLQQSPPAPPPGLYSRKRAPAGLSRPAQPRQSGSLGTKRGLVPRTFDLTALGKDEGKTRRGSLAHRGPARSHRTPQPGAGPWVTSVARKQ